MILNALRIALTPARRVGWQRSDRGFEFPQRCPTAPGTRWSQVQMRKARLVHTPAQVGIPFATQPLARPLLTEPVIAVFRRAASDSYAIRQPA